MNIQTRLLADVASIQRHSVNPEAVDPATPYLGLEHVGSDGTLNWTESVGSSDVKSGKYRFSRRDVLFGKLRPYLSKIARPDRDGVCSTDIIPVLPGSSIDRGYLFHFLRLPATVELATRLSSGANLPRLSPQRLAEFQIPLPPLTEQKRITAILDEADTLRAKRRESLALLDKFVQSVFLDMFGDPVTNPKRWDTVALDEIGQFTSGGTPSRERAEFWNGTIPWVSPKDMKVPILSDAIEHVSDLAFEETSLKLLPPGTLLMVVRGMILAHSFPVGFNTVPLAINQDMKGVALRPELDLRYTLHCLQLLERAVLAEVSTAGHGTRRLDATAMQRLRVPTPPITLQREFGEVMRAAVDQRERMTSHLAELDTLFASLQSRAFRGDL